MKDNLLPAASDVKAWLSALTYEQMERLAELSGVGFGTLVKIRTGDTANPGIETVRKFVPFLSAVKTA